MGFIDKTIISMFGITALSNSAYALIAPFLPFQFEQKGLSQSLIGYIFAVYSIAVIFCSPLVGMVIPKIGRRNLIQIGTLMQGIAFTAFALSKHVENKTMYTIATLSIRFF